MAADTKKVILFIAEGPTDEYALSPVLKKIFQNSHVRFHVVHGDLTSDFTVDNSNAVKTVNSHIKMEQRHHQGYPPDRYRWSLYPKRQRGSRRCRAHTIRGESDCDQVCAADDCSKRAKATRSIPALPRKDDREEPLCGLLLFKKHGACAAQ